MRKALAALFLILAPLSVWAQTLSEDEIKALALEAIRENPQIVVEALEAIQAEQEAAEAAAQAQTLAARRDLLENDPNAPVVGNPDGETVIVEFFDYNCPYCKRVAPDVATLIAENGDLRVVYREWPILGEGSVFAARAALAARNQGLYEEMHWALMELEGRADPASVLAAARSVGLDTDQLQADMDAPEVVEHFRTSQALAQELGITGTPAFVIGDAVVPGAVPLAELQARVAHMASGN